MLPDNDFRKKASLEILKSMISAPGEKIHKVNAAIEYADMLIHELSESERMQNETALESLKTVQKSIRRYVR